MTTPEKRKIEFIFQVDPGTSGLVIGDPEEGLSPAKRSKIQVIDRSKKKDRLSDEEFTEICKKLNSFSNMSPKKVSKELRNIQLKKYVEAENRQKVLEEERKRTDEYRLSRKYYDAFKRRILIQDIEMKKYFRKNLFDEKSFHKDIQSYDSLYVFSYSYAKIETPKYKDFMASLADDHHNYKVYFARNKALVYSVGWAKELTPDKEKLKPEDWGYKAKEFDTGLSDIGRMLDGDEYSGVLLTNKTEDEVLSKFDEYEEFDFVIPPNDKPIETVVFREGEVLPLPPLLRAKKLCPKLKKLGMPVELSGQNIKLTEQFVVCEVGKRVTEEAAKIMILLEIKMKRFFLLPIGSWSRMTKEVKRYLLDVNYYIEFGYFPRRRK